MAEHSFLTQQKIGTQFSGVYYVAGVSVKKTKTDKEYTEYTLKDRSGTEFAKLWGVDPTITKGVYVSAAINVDDYQGKPSFIIRNIALFTKKVDESLYVPVAENVEELKAVFESKLQELKTDSVDLKAPIGGILDSVFTASVKAEFYKAPSNAGVYYGKVGGALENTVNIFKICETLAETYKLSNDEKAVLRTAVLLSRVPSIEVYKMADCATEVTKSGALLGMRSMGILRIFETWKLYRDGTKNPSDKEWFLRILHAMNAQEGTENIPLTKEAVVLQMAIQMDARMVEMFDYINREESFENGFTSYDPSSKRKYYVSAKS